MFSNPQDLEARGKVLLGASHAGVAIENSMLGAAHSMANPLTASRGVVHGQAVGIALPVVMRFNAELPAIRSIYAGLARDADLVSEGSSDIAAAESCIVRVENLLVAAGFPATLNDLGFSAEDLSALASEAAEQWTAGFNPRSVSVEDFEKLFASILAKSACNQA